MKTRTSPVQLASFLSDGNRQRLARAILWSGVAGFVVVLSTVFLKALSWDPREGLYVMTSGACYACGILLLGRAGSRALVAPANGNPQASPGRDGQS